MDEVIWYTKIITKREYREMNPILLRRFSKIGVLPFVESVSLCSDWFAVCTFAFSYGVLGGGVLWSVVCDCRLRP